MGQIDFARIAMANRIQESEPMCDCMHDGGGADGVSYLSFISYGCVWCTDVCMLNAILIDRIELMGG